MSFLLDTDICSAFLKGNAQVWSKVIQHSGRLHISVITLGELCTWASRATAPPARSRALEDLVGSLAVENVSPAVARRFGELRAALLDAGSPVPDMDLLIAATALVNDLTLVTHNVEDYVRVDGLRVDDWTIR